MALAHSYSAIKDFENCARKYHKTRILKLYKQEDTEATLYGTTVHKHLEEYVRDGTPIPPAYSQFQPFAEPIAHMPGRKYCEEKLGIRADFSPCGFFDPDVWFRGIPDVLCVGDSGVARVVDWKTGKSAKYADVGQLELLAGMIMAHHPQVTHVRGALVFLVANAVVRAEFSRAQFPEIMSKWAGKASMIEAAVVNDVWNPKSGPLCKFCPVPAGECEFKR